MALSIQHRFKSISPLVWLTLLICLCLVPFADKAFHIDDTLFLRAAEHIQKQPADFYGFSMNWYGSTRPMIENFDNPPLACYYLAGTSSILGWSETALHLSFFLPALAVIGGIFRLGRTFNAPPLLAAAAGAVMPVFFVSATTLMSDVLLLAFWVWAVAFFERGFQNDARADFFVSGLLAGLACLTKFTGLALVPLLCAYACVRARKAGPWLIAPVMALLLAAAYECISFELYGQGLLFTAASVSTHAKAAHGGTFVGRQITGLTYLGGCYLPLLFFASRLWSLRMIVTWVCVTAPVLLTCPYSGIFVVLWEPSGRPNWLLCLQTALFIFSGIHVLLLAAHDFWKSRNAASILLLLWTGGIFVFTTVFNWTVNGRSLLPMLPAVALLLARQIERRSAELKLPKAWFRLWQFAPAAALTVLVARADYMLADTARSAAKDVQAAYSASGKATWFEGHWGFQRYMEQGGARALERDFPRARPGDIVVIPSEAVNLFDIPATVVRLVDTLDYQPHTFCATMSTSAGAGFYAATAGPFPFSFAQMDPERYYVFQFIAKPSSADLTPGHTAGPGALTQQFKLEHMTHIREHVLKLNPQNTAARLELAELAQAQQRRGEAIRQYKLVLADTPDCVTALNNLAWILATDKEPRFRNGGEAIRFARKADTLTRNKEPQIILTLSAALAEAGQFQDAVCNAETALELAKASDQSEWIAAGEKLLERFRQGQAFHQFSEKMDGDSSLAAAAGS